MLPTFPPKKIIGLRMGLRNRLILGMRDFYRSPIPPEEGRSLPPEGVLEKFMDIFND